MKITKLVHACLLVETPEATAIFDPGSYSTVDVDSIDRLDDIIITHSHGDHFDLETVKKLVAKFPLVNVTAPSDIVGELKAQNISASSEPSERVALFDSPHEELRPLMDVDPPLEIGAHWLDLVSHPGDSHSFNETKAVLALPMQAPWGSPRRAAELAIELKPQYVVPIHDIHWSDSGRESMYNSFEKSLGEHGIKFVKAVNGESFEINV